MFQFVFRKKDRWWSSKQRLHPPPVQTANTRILMGKTIFCSLLNLFQSHRRESRKNRERSDLYAWTISTRGWRFQRMSKNSREMKNGDIGRLCQVSTNLSPGHISITPITHNSIYHQFYTLIGPLFHLQKLQEYWHSKYKWQIKIPKIMRSFMRRMVKWRWWRWWQSRKKGLMRPSQLQCDAVCCER